MPIVSVNKVCRPGGGGVGFLGTGGGATMAHALFGEATGNALEEKVRVRVLVRKSGMRLGGIGRGWL